MIHNQAAFFTFASPLSNMFDCDFWVDGVRYHTSEQYIVEQKALLFGDINTANLVKSLSSPVHMKWRGKGVEGFNRAVWHKNAPSLILPGLRAKFEQVNVCRALLLATGARLIVEASPHDKFWGVGLGLRDERLWDQKSHQGRNMMGNLLMTVRREIMSQI